MRAVILAAGYGRRMRPLTDTTHKTLLTVAGKTIIGRIMDGLIANGIPETAVVTGYRAEELEGYLRGAYPGHCFHFIHNARYAETNNIHSLALAFEQLPLDRDILLIESDLIFEPEVLTQLLRSPHRDVALVDHYRTGMDGTVVSISNGIVTNVIPPHLQQEDFSFAGKYKTLNIYKLSAELCSGQLHRLLTFYARYIDDNCYYELILGMLIYMRQARIHAEVVEGALWAEVDDPNDLHAAEFVFNGAGRGQILDRTMGGYWAHNVLDFCFLRNMYFPTAAVMAEIRNSVAALVQNYGSKQTVLNEKLSYLLLCEASCVQVLNGASQVYPFLKRRFEGVNALIPVPTFGEYKTAFPRHETYADDGHFDIEDVGCKAKDAEVVVFVTPNNPTGTTCDASEILAFARRNPGKTILVDESFLAFHTGELCGAGSMVRLLERDPLENVHVICSLSKTLGMPGLRLGYIYSRNARLLGELGTDLPIWNLNSVAEFVMEVALKHRAGIEDSLRATARDRDAFRERLLSLNAVESVWPGGGNFLLVRFRREAGRGRAEAAALLADHAIHVKDLSARFDDGRAWWRLAVRLPDENARLCDAILPL
jgi:histidinol-phosphate/aromatic aminotransferase/cobyric acid decarboxylase-like protein/GTP:adenosylcobinamide-phosphate guanylyltransferase